MANNQIALLAKIPEFDTPLESQGKALKIQQMMNDRQVQEMDMQQRREAIQRTAGLRSTLAGFKPDSTPDEQVGVLTRNGYLPEARSLAESSSKVSKEKREAEKFELESHFKKFELVGQIMGGARDQASYDQARAQMAQIFPEAAEKMPVQYDPVAIERNRTQALGVKEQLEQVWKQKGYDREVARDAESVRHNRATENNTIRGQDMANDRAKESRKDALSKPFEVTGPDGMPVLVQQSKNGIVPVEGYMPKRPPAKPLAPAVVKQLQEARDNATTMDRLNTSFKDDFASKGVLGFGADLQMSAAGTLGKDQDAVAWWKDYRKSAELTERHSLFGAALTPSEQASWRSADIGPGLDKATIKTNLATRAALTKKILNATKQDMIDAGHNSDRVTFIADRDSTAPPAAGGAKPSLGQIFGE